LDIVEKIDGVTRGKSRLGDGEMGSEKIDREKGRNGDKLIISDSKSRLEEIPHQ